MSTEQMRRYPSKIDWWLVPVLCVPPVVAITVCVALALAGKLLVGFVVVLFTLGVYFGLVVPMRYGLDDTHLVVRFGICRQRILLADISEVHPTRSLIGSPAGSINRLRVQYGQGVVKDEEMISPANRDRFLDELAQKAGLKREGDRLFRVSSVSGHQGH